MTAEPDQPEPQVRGMMSILGRAVAGLLAGAAVGAVVHPNPDALRLGDAAFAGLAGLLLGGVAGVFVWVAFPYRRAG